MSGTITFDIHNGGKMTLEQYNHDKAVEFTVRVPRQTALLNMTLASIFHPPTSLCL